MSAQCGRCGRVLTSEASVRRGYGRACKAKLQANEEAVASQYQPHQVMSAHELIEDGAIVRTRPGIYMAVSSDGTQVYRCARQACNCPASKPCYHMVAIAIIEGDIPVSRTPVVLPAPRKAPEWLADVCQYGDLDPVTHTVKNGRGIQGMCGYHAAGYGYPEYLTPIAA